MVCGTFLAIEYQVSTNANVIGKVYEDSLAQAAGLADGDTVLVKGSRGKGAQFVKRSGEDANISDSFSVAGFVFVEGLVDLFHVLVEDLVVFLIIGRDIHRLRF